MKNLVGQTLGRYEIIEKFGEGGMAIVYKAHDTRLERDVALKIIRNDIFGVAFIERILARFEREAKAMAKLSHPNIVKIHDFGEHEGSPYLVMELISGGTLKGFLGKPMSWEEATDFLLPIADALSYAHKKGIVHRDIKPGNILITERRISMLTDFGIARLLENEEGQTLTGTGVGVGTPEYMSPEQGLGREVDERTDIYSLGVVYYELLTGRKPYTADTPMAVVLKQSTEPLPRPTDIVRDLPTKVENILFKALAKNPDDRYLNMDEMYSELIQLNGRDIRQSNVTQKTGREIEKKNDLQNSNLTQDQMEILEIKTQKNTKEPTFLLSIKKLWKKPIIWAGFTGILVLTMLIIGMIKGFSPFQIINNDINDTEIVTEISTVDMATQISASTAQNVKLLGSIGNGVFQKISLSPEGKILAVGTTIGIDLYDSSTFELVRHISNTSSQNKVVFSPDGSLIATTFSNKNSFSDDFIKIWRISDGMLVNTIEGVKRYISDIVFSSDNQFLFTTSFNTNVVTNKWLVSDGSMVYEIDLSKFPFAQPIISPDAAFFLLYFEEYGSDFALFSITGGNSVGGFKMPNDNKTLRIIFSQDGTLGAILTQGDLFVWRLYDNEIVNQISLPPDRGYTNIAFSSDSSLIAAGNESGAVYVFQLSSGDLLQTIDTKTSGIDELIISKDNQILYTLTWPSKIDRWVISTGIKNNSIESEFNYVWSLDYSPDGSIIAQSNRETGVISLISTENKSLNGTLQCSDDDVLSVSFSHDGNLLAAGLSTGDIEIWDMQNRSLIKTLKGASDATRHLAFSPDDSILASGSDDKTVRLWTVADSRVVANKVFEDYIKCVAFSPDAQYLGICANGSTLSILDAETLDEVQLFKGPETSLEYDKNFLYGMDFSPSGENIAASGGNGAITIWRFGESTPFYPLLEMMRLP